MSDLHWHRCVLPMSVILSRGSRVGLSSLSSSLYSRQLQVSLMTGASISYLERIGFSPRHLSIKQGRISSWTATFSVEILLIDFGKTIASIAIFYNSYPSSMFIALRDIDFGRCRRTASAAKYLRGPAGFDFIFREWNGLRGNFI